MTTPKENSFGQEAVILNNEKEDLEIIAQNKTIANFDIDGFLAMRKEFIEKVNAIMVAGKDYHVIQGKKSLAKGGAEKIASIFGWTAQFEKDQATAESFSEIKGLIAFVCNLSKTGHLVGQGRGAATLIKNSSDPNKTIKMAQKSAYIDAVIRASGMSDFFTQDLEDMPKEQVVHTNDGDIIEPAKPKPTDKQKWLIGKLCKDKGITQDQALKLAEGKSPSEFIKVLMEYRGGL